MEKLKVMYKKAEMIVKKNSPAILLVSGLAGYGVTGILVYKSRPKIERIVEHLEASRERDIEIDKVAVGKELFKAVAPAIAMATLSTGAVIWSYNIQNNRVMTLASVLAATQASQIAFEQKFKEKFGTQAYNDLITSDQNHYSEEDENGETIDKIENVRSDLNSSFGEWYDKSEYYTSDDDDYNLEWIRAKEEDLQNILFADQTLLVNQVREMLGFEKTMEGALMGFSSWDNFRIDVMPYNEEHPVTHEIKTQFYVQWTKPKYIYDKIKFNKKEIW